DVHVNGFAPAFTAKADPNTANGRCWMSNTSSGINNQGYLDQVSFDDGGEYRRCNSHSSVEMLGTSDDLNPRNFQHTTATTSDDKSFPTTVWPVTALSTPPEGLEDAIDDYDGSFTSICDPNVDERRASDGGSDLKDNFASGCVSAILLVPKHPCSASMVFFLQPYLKMTAP
ncbi:hypothetical protein PQX77_001845, partial [Marasmius sp. AFHP31]